jgi:hypothetical protein
VTKPLTPEDEAIGRARDFLACQSGATMRFLPQPLMDALIAKLDELRRLPVLPTCGDCQHHGWPGATVMTEDGVRHVQSTAHCRKAHAGLPGIPPAAELLPGEVMAAKWPVHTDQPPPEWCPWRRVQ